MAEQVTTESVKKAIWGKLNALLPRKVIFLLVIAISFSSIWLGINGSGIIGENPALVMQILAIIAILYGVICFSFFINSLVHGLKWVTWTDNEVQHIDRAYKRNKCLRLEIVFCLMLSVLCFVPSGIYWVQHDQELQRDKQTAIWVSSLDALWDRTEKIFEKSSNPTVREISETIEELYCHLEQDYPVQLFEREDGAYDIKKGSPDAYAPDMNDVILQMIIECYKILDKCAPVEEYNTLDIIERIEDGLGGPIRIEGPRDWEYKAAEIEKQRYVSLVNNDDEGAAKYNLGLVFLYTEHFGEIYEHHGFSDDFEDDFEDDFVGIMALTRQCIMRKVVITFNIEAIDYKVISVPVDLFEIISGNVRIAENYRVLGRHSLAYDYTRIAWELFDYYREETGGYYYTGLDAYLLTFLIENSVRDTALWFASRWTDLLREAYETEIENDNIPQALQYGLDEANIRFYTMNDKIRAQNLLYQMQSIVEKFGDVHLKRAYWDLFYEVTSRFPLVDVQDD
jgi:hypothetical protein